MEVTRKQKFYLALALSGDRLPHLEKRFQAPKELIELFVDDPESAVKRIKFWRDTDREREKNEFTERIECYNSEVLRRKGYSVNLSFREYFEEVIRLSGDRFSALIKNWGGLSMVKVNAIIDGKHTNRRIEPKIIGYCESAVEQYNRTHKGKIDFTLKQLFGIAKGIEQKKPSQIAKEFGVTQEAIRRVLAGEMASKPLELKIVDYVEQVLAGKLAEDRPDQRSGERPFPLNQCEPLNDQPAVIMAKPRFFPVNDCPP